MMKQQDSLTQTPYKIEKAFRPLQKVIGKAKKLTLLKQVQEAEKVLIEFKQRIIDFEKKIIINEEALYEKKRYLMTVSPEDASQRELLIDEILDLEQTISDSRETLFNYNKRYDDLNKAFHENYITH